MSLGRKIPRLARFERRVLGAIAAVIMVPVIAALLLGRVVLEEAYAVGVNGRVGGALEQSLSLHRELLVALRNDADHIADAIARDASLERALAGADASAIRAELGVFLERYPALSAIHIECEHCQGLSVERPLPPSHRELELTREMEGPTSAVARISASAPDSLFERYERAGETVEVYRHLREGTDWLSSTYLAVFIALLLVVVALAMTIGLYVGRRMTRRVMLVAEGTRRVGRGDLDVEIPAYGDDEVAELMQSFNEMVRDIRTSRDRIEYLKRVGAWQEMAKRLAHEIKNPLTPIQLAVQELHRGYRDSDPKYKKTLDDARAIVEEEVTTLRRLVREFSEFARLPTPELEPADLSEFAHGAVRGLDARALASSESDRELDATISLELEAEPLPVSIDQQLLRRSLDNLVRNAVQAVAGAGMNQEGQVTVATRKEGAFAVLEVRDNGPGIPLEMRERVFDPYVTTKRTGTGLGLSIVKKTVLEHGGTIRCDAAPETGARFRIALPLRRNVNPRRVTS